MNNRAIVLVLSRQEQSEIVVRRRVRRADSNSLLVLLDGSLDVSDLSQRRSQIHTRRDAGGVSGDGFAKLVRRFRKPSRVESHPATNQVKTLSLDEFL